jgi:hypothetical protein
MNQNMQMVFWAWLKRNIKTINIENEAAIFIQSRKLLSFDHKTKQKLFKTLCFITVVLTNIWKYILLKVMAITPYYYYYKNLKI